MPAPLPDAAPAKRRFRLPRLAALLAAVAVAVVVGLPLAARQAIGPERLRVMVEQALTDALGRQVSVSGDVSIILAPWFGLSMGPVAVAEAPGFGDQPMLTAGRLEMTIRVLPLLAKVVSPGSVRVSDLAVNLTRRADGRANWDDLTAPKDSAAEAGWTVAPQPRDIRLENVSARFDDAAAGRRLAVTGARLRTGLGQPFNFSGSFTATGLLPETAVECHLQGRASFDPASGRLGLHAATVETAVVTSAPLVPGGAVPARVVSRLTLDYDPAAAVLTLSDIDARAPGLQLTGAATVTGLPGAPSLRAETALAADLDGNWRELLGLSRPGGSDSLMAQPAPGTDPQTPPADPTAAALGPAPPAPGIAEAAVTATADASGLRLERLDIRLPKGRIQAAGTATFGDKPAVSGEITAEDVPFDALPRPGGGSGWPIPGPWIFGCDLDVRAVLHRSTVAGLDIAEAAATLRGGGGLVRLYPAAAVLPGGGVVSLDARLTDSGGPDGGPGCDIAAALEPVGTRTRFVGRLDATGAAGTWTLASPDPAAAAKALGLDALPALPAEARGQLTLLAGPAGKWALSGLEAKVAGTTLRGQLGAADPPDELAFDLAMDGLDLARLPAAAAPAAGSGRLPRARGKLRLEHLAGGGLEARNLVLDLTLGDAGLTAAVENADLFGGKLTGSVERLGSGRITAALQLAGAEAGRLVARPGLQLTGPVTARLAFEAAGSAKGPLGAMTASLEAESPQLFLTRAGQRQPVAAPKASLTVKGVDDADGFDGDAALTIISAGADGGVATLGLRDIRLNLAAPVSLDRAWRLKDPVAGKIEASALAQPAGAARDIRLTLTGPVTADNAGGFSAGDLALNFGGAAGVARIWRKAGETGPTAFRLETGTLQPRQVLPAWGVAVSAEVPADKLAKASLAASGTVDDKAITVSRLAFTLDETHVTGHGVMDRFEPGRGKWDLSIDRLDLDAYTPHKPAAGPPPPAERRKPLDFKGLRDMALETRLHFGWLKKGNVTFDASSVVFLAKGGLFTFRQESSRFYGGRLFTEVRGDARDTALKTIIELKLEGIEIARFLHDWAEGDTLAAGTCTFVVAARTSGASEEELRGNLAGNGSLQVTRGELKVRDPDHKSGGQPQEERIPFDVFSSTWNAKGGVAHSDDFRIEGPRMLVAGKGQVDLRDETIHLSLMASLAGGGEVPATIIGPLDGPKLTIDRSRIIGDMVYRVLQGIVSIPGKAVTRILQLPLR
ncbi:AsmA family protein [Solidesulfovibrio sp.]